MNFSPEIVEGILLVLGGQMDRSGNWREGKIKGRVGRKEAAPETLLYRNVWEQVLLGSYWKEAKTQC